MSNAELSRGQGEVFLDARGNGRTLRLTWHHEAGLVVLSLWRDGLCAGTFRLFKQDVDVFVEAMVAGLRDEPLPTPASQHRVHVDATQAGPPSFTDWAFGDEMPGQRANAS